MLTMIFSILSVSREVDGTLGQIEFQVDMILMALIFELIFILILLFVIKDGGSTSARQVTHRPPPPDAGDNQTQSGPTHIKQRSQKQKVLVGHRLPAFKVALTLAHPVNSSIAGVLSLVLALQRFDGTLLSSLATFLSTTALCAFGYVVNDIFDLPKGPARASHR